MTDKSEQWWLYLIRMANGNLYCGITNDLERRVNEHQSNGIKCAKALRGKGPLRLVYAHSVATKTLALQYEWQVKQWKKSEKERLITGEKSLNIDVIS